MACDLGGAEEPPPRHAAAFGALEQPRLRLILDAPGRERTPRRRLHVASARAAVLGSVATRHAPAHLGAVAMLRLRRRALADHDEEQVGGVAEYAIERTAEVRTPLLPCTLRRRVSLFDYFVCWPGLGDLVLGMP